MNQTKEQWLCAHRDALVLAALRRGRGADDAACRERAAECLRRYDEAVAREVAEGVSAGRIRPTG